MNVKIRPLQVFSHILTCHAPARVINQLCLTLQKWSKQHQETETPPMSNFLTCATKTLQSLLVFLSYYLFEKCSNCWFVITFVLPFLCMTFKLLYSEAGIQIKH